MWDSPPSCVELTGGLSDVDRGDHRRMRRSASEFDACPLAAQASLRHNARGDPSHREGEFSWADCF
jgi:hypothetical protein